MLLFTGNSLMSIAFGYFAVSFYFVIVSKSSITPKPLDVIPLHGILHFEALVYINFHMS